MVEFACFLPFNDNKPCTYRVIMHILSVKKGVKDVQIAETTFEIDEKVKYAVHNLHKKMDGRK